MRMCQFSCLSRLMMMQKSVTFVCLLTMHICICTRDIIIQCNVLTSGHDHHDDKSPFYLLSFFALAFAFLPRAATKNVRLANMNAIVIAMR